MKKKVIHYFRNIPASGVGILLYLAKQQYMRHGSPPANTSVVTSYKYFYTMASLKSVTKRDGIALVGD